jgi:Pyruvate/2-oxoglutarate dehydrogenase complex, dehydrogenase (E1) component, eukaryotic type, alpha subunit
MDDPLPKTKVLTMYSYDEQAPNCSTGPCTTLVEDLRAMWRQMLRIRVVQDRIAKVYHEDEMRTPVHLCVGQEASAVGVCHALRRGDLVFSNHRGHGHYLAKGGDLNAMMAELFCRETGCSKGRGGSMHLIDLEAGLPGSSSIVAGGVPLATGAALALKMQKRDDISVVFFGDAAAEEGAFYESMNIAALWNLPVLFVCENNFFAVCSPLSQRASNEIYCRAQSFGMSASALDGTDVEEVYAAAAQSAERVRSGSGPAFLEVRAYRWKGHCGGEEDTDAAEGASDSLASWKAECPVEKAAERLIAAGVLDAAEVASVRAAIEAEVDAAFALARSGPLPDGSTVLRDVYAE